MRMYHAVGGHLVATAEWMNLHVDMQVRRVAPWPQAILERIGHYVAQQGEYPWPDEAGKRMEIKRPLFTAKPEFL